MSPTTPSASPSEFGFYTPQLPPASPVQGHTTTSEWQSSSQATMEAAMRVLKLADRDYQSSARVHFKNKRDGTKHYRRFSAVQAQFQKSNMAKRLHIQLQDRVRSMTQSARLMRRSVEGLHAALEPNTDAIQLCDWRMEQRAQRPERELVRDDLEIALEAEREALGRAYDLLSHSSDHTECELAKLEHLLNQLVREEHKHRNPNDANGPGLPGQAHPSCSSSLEEVPGAAVGKELLTFLDSQGTTLRQFFQSTTMEGSQRTTMRDFTAGLKQVGFIQEGLQNRMGVDAKKLYCAMDSDNTGSLSWWEVQAFFSSLRQTLRHNHPVGLAIMKFVDEKGINMGQLWQFIHESPEARVDLNEFLAAMKKVGFLNEALSDRSSAACKDFFTSTDKEEGSDRLSWPKFQKFFADIVRFREDLNAKNTEQETVRMLHQAKNMEDEMKALREANQRTIRTTVAESSLALRHVKAEMLKRIDQTNVMKKRLGFLVSEAESRIGLHSWRQTWSDHKELREAQKSPKAVKSGRGGRKYFAEAPDLVAAADSLERQEGLEPLEVLQGLKENLLADFQDKDQALRIDQQCLDAICVGGNITIESSQPPKTGGRSMGTPRK